MLDVIERIYRDHSRMVLATLVRLLGDFDRAEEALHDAFAIAAQQWPTRGVPQNPAAWLVSAGRFRGLDHMRRQKRFADKTMDITDSLYPEEDGPDTLDASMLKDDFLRLIFICCHPALAPDAQLALALREVCGLKTEEIARAFFASAPTIAQRIVRAKARIRDLALPYEIPEPAALPARLAAVLHVIYLMFNEGYAASSGTMLLRVDLADEAIRLARELIALLPQGEVFSLAALMLFQHSRAGARTAADGSLILLADQDRSLWKQEMVAEGVALLNRAQAAGPPGAYGLQAGIAAMHATAATFAETDWRQIAALYDRLLQIQPSPVVGLNRAVAIGMVSGPEAGLNAVDALMDLPQMINNHLAHAARADFLRQLGQVDMARAAYQTALDLARLEPERAFLRKRISELV